MLVEIAASRWPPASGEVDFSVSVLDTLARARLTRLPGWCVSLIFLRVAASF